MDLSNENVIHVKNNGIEYLQFRKLLSYPDIKHIYSLGKQDYRTAKPSKEPLDEQKYKEAVQNYDNLCKTIGESSRNVIQARQIHSDFSTIVDVNERNNKSNTQYSNENNDESNNKNENNNENNDESNNKNQDNNENNRENHTGSNNKNENNDESNNKNSIENSNENNNKNDENEKYNSKQNQKELTEIKELKIAPNTDALITNKKDVLLATTNADCILLLLYDPVKKIVANVHSGWRGTLQRIVIKTINKMQNEFNSNPKDIICCICPSIRKCHFEVDKNVKDLFEKEFSEVLNKYAINNDICDIIEETKTNEKWNIDTVLINKLLLKELGLKDENIIDSNICSVCNHDLIHSYRVEKEGYGVATAMIELV